MLDDLDSLWDFNDPALSERRFRQRLEGVFDANDRAECLSQLSRSVGLQRRFDEAHEVLDEAAGLIEAGSRAEVRYMLERGRVINSSGGRVASRQVFHQALEAAQAIGEEGLAVDAAHMLGIVEDDDQSLAWNLKAIEMAEASSAPDAQKWRASLYNNTGWTLFSKKRLEEALDLFRKARDVREERGQIREEQIARWCVARCLREMGNRDEATRMQEQLLGEVEQDGFISEELAELYAAAGKVSESKMHAKTAHELLSKDAWFVESEAARLSRLVELSNQGGNG